MSADQQNEGWLVTIEWEMGTAGPDGVPIPPMSSYEKFFTSFTTMSPGRYFIETKKEFPSALALINVTPVWLTDNEIEMLS